jgi:predicted DNA-binding transcriptional regulator YafY
MARPDRLLRLLQIMRTLPQPVTAGRLASETEVSLRTMYRDIDTLRAGGALIDGSAGFGYTLLEDAALPPQMFTQIEIEALMLGLAEVRISGDEELAIAAKSTQAKIIATLPERVQRQAMHAISHAYHFDPRPKAPPHVGLLRRASWEEREVEILYRDRDSAETRRIIRPLSIVFLERRLMLLAWCCLRQDYRRFDLHKVVEAVETARSFRPHRVTLLREYRARLAEP